jgi:hypothetical protein
VCRRVGENLNECGGVRPVAIVTHAVDKKSWRAVHAAADAATEVITHLLRVRAGGKLARNPLRIDPDVFRVDEKVRVLEGALVVKKHVVHLPESPLRAGGLGCLRGVLGVRVRLRERKVPKHESQVIAHATPHALNHRIGAAAIRTLEVSVLDERNRSSCGTERMVAVAHRYCQSC